LGMDRDEDMEDGEGWRDGPGGGGERAENTSEMSVDARFWFFANVEFPFCNSSHFRPTLPTHEDTGCAPAATAAEPAVSASDPRGNPAAFIITLALFALDSFRSKGDVNTGE